MDHCPRCRRVLHGELGVVQGQLEDGTWFVGIQGTPDRDWILCDSCNAMLCHNCCTDPQSGYCDDCVAKYKSSEYFKENGLIPREEIMQGRIVGTWESRKVLINGIPLSPEKSQRVWNHSPAGFNWSYGGSGPAQLALAILLELTSREEAVRWHQEFKRDMIARLPPQDFELPVSDVESWIERKRKQGDQIEPGERIHFTEAEAKRKIDGSIRSVIEFCGVPEGTRGKITRADAVKVGQFSVGIEWELPVSGKPLANKPKYQIIIDGALRYMGFGFRLDECVERLSFFERSGFQVSILSRRTEELLKNFERVGVATTKKTGKRKAEPRKKERPATSIPE